MYGAVEFYKAALEAGIKPILGCEVYVAEGSRFTKEGKGGGYYHLVLLAENNEGYHNLIKLVSYGDVYKRQVLHSLTCVSVIHPSDLHIW